MSTYKHINRLVTSTYFRNLVYLRDTISSSCDLYFNKLHAPKVDLYMITQGVSSPMGKGSDSIALPLKFGKKNAYLVDSAQFGMEPLVLKHHKMVYCYLPSFRGEKPDARHLNQFYHCEAEIRGGLEMCLNTVNSLVKFIAQRVLDARAEELVYLNKKVVSVLEKTTQEQFPIITFDDAIRVLDRKVGTSGYKKYKFGRVITNTGEQELAKYVGKGLPVWVTHYDRDTVAFYQKPDSLNKEKVLNADLIFPSVCGGFGGEIVGAGQRQNKSSEMIESMHRQGINNIYAYDWYLKLRKHKYYTTTSGFGLGIERLVAWMLCKKAIADACIYPVMKDRILV